MGEEALKLVVCGTGPMEKWCKEFVKSNKLNVEFKGFVPNAEVLKIVANSKALVLPTQWYEGFPMSIVEAFSVGTPVICSDLGNAGSIVDDGINGIKFQYNSSKDIVAAINRFQKMDEKKIEENARLKSNEKFDSDINYKIIENIYNSVKKRLFAGY